MIVQRHPEVLWRRSATKVLVLPRDADAPAVLTGLPAAIWEVLETPVPEDDLAEDVSAALDVPILQAGETVSKLLEELIRLGVVECRPTT